MFAALARIGGGLLKNILPQAIGWGVKKLQSTGIGKTILSPQVLGMASNVLGTIQNVASGGGTETPV